MRKQATINIGTIGHVAHGKTTVVKSVSGVNTIKYTSEKKRNITIKLGYANAKVYKCDNPTCPRPGCYKSYGSGKEDHPTCERPGCGGRMELLRHVSFVDCPGHDILMATMLNGAAVMDAALLLIAGNEPCPQPQTSEHLAAIDIMKLNHVIILQNKIDLVRESQAAAQYQDILAFIKDTIADNAPVIPISAQLGYNIDILAEYMVKHIPIPVRDYTSSPKLIVIRSFDINKPSTPARELRGGVAGGSLLQGILRVGQEIEVRPGLILRDENDRVRVRPIFSRIMSLNAEDNRLEYAVPGGLIGVGTKIDPTLCRADRLIGAILGNAGDLPDVFTELEISFFLLRRLLGVKADEGARQARVSKLNRNELLMLNIGSTTTGGRVVAVTKDLCKIALAVPVCTSEGEKIALSRKIAKHWRLIGWGQIHGGVRIRLD
eukprot:gnl/Trimastix_PCT/523.p1 GENE.gnl/Trimastix_PCT/523~~gnl/Trimastix_PCT/523.p1  ORF type:complete len:503 (+),score=119.26 gnl/Trimastix_PCT/523:208-1509(+)